MKTIGSLKAILLLLTLGVFACIAHADIFVGQPNQELDFTITTPGYYAITLSADIDFVNFSNFSLQTVMNGITVPFLRVDYGAGVNWPSEVIQYFNVGSNSITANPNNATGYWAYTVQTADPDNSSQALTNLQNQVTSLQNSVTNLGTNSTTALAAQNQQLANINTALSTVQAALASNQALTDALSSQITSLQNQIIQMETNNFNALQNQITTLQNTVNQQNAFEQQIFVGTINTPLNNTPLEFDIIMPGYYDITLDDNLFLTGYAPGAYITLTTSLNGVPVSIMSPSTALKDLTLSNGSYESTQYFVAGHYTISGDMTFFNLNNNTVTNNSTWFYTVKPTR